MNRPFALIVEDDPELGDLVSLILKLVEFETEVISDGRLALARIVERIPEIVLLDMHLPGMSGLEILKQIRADPQLKHIKVVVVTADALMITQCEGIADLALTKPVTVDQISLLTQRLIQPKNSEKAEYKQVAITG